MYEKDFINKCNIRTTIYDQIKDKEQLKYSSNLIPGILKTCTMGYDGRGQHKINSVEDIDRLNIDYQYPIYQGDTVRNSFGDTISAALGYFAKRPKS